MIHLYYDEFLQVPSQVPKNGKYSININEKIYYAPQNNIKKGNFYVTALRVQCAMDFFLVAFMQMDAMISKVK